ncbi:MAG: c-type cytochrome [Planctomycetes bacterium]|nr:c-type cytochrome [Planctomycetota bacterium]
MRILSILICLTVPISCSGEPESPNLDLAVVDQLFGNWPNAPTVDGEPTPAKIALGDTLYHEKRLSRHGDISCASCHDLEKFGQDGLPTSPGTAGASGKRNAPTTFDAFRQFAQFWDFRAATVEEQSTMPMTTDVEHGLTGDQEIEAILRGIPEYSASFAAAFPGQAQPITADNVRAAIGAFERTLVTRSRFDHFLDGERDALSAAEQKGLATFIEAGCITCHKTRAVGGEIANKLGLVVPFESEDLGRYAVTGQESDKLMFKVPMLRNVAETAPYFHDGSIETLEEAIRIMGKHQLGRDLTARQVDEIATFLRSLTGKRIAE